MPSNVLPLHLKQTFRPIIWIFTEGDEIESRLPFKIFSTLHEMSWPIVILFIFTKMGRNFMMFFFLPVSSYYICTKSMNNFKIHKLLKKKHPAIFYIFYSRCFKYVHILSDQKVDKNGGVYGFYIWNSFFKPKSYWLIMQMNH